MRDLLRRKVLERVVATADWRNLLDLFDRPASNTLAFSLLRDCAEATGLPFGPGDLRKLFDSFVAEGCGTTQAFRNLAQAVLMRAMPPASAP